MNQKEIEESIRQTELEIVEKIKKSYELSRKADKFTIVTSIFIIIAFSVITITTIMHSIETNNTKRIDDLSSRIERIEKDNVYRDEVINQTRTEMNF